MDLETVFQQKLVVAIDKDDVVAKELWIHNSIIFNHKRGAVSWSLYNERHSSGFVTINDEYERLRIGIGIRIGVDSRELRFILPSIQNSKADTSN